MKLINEYIDSLFSSQDNILDEVISSIEENDMRPMSVSPSTGNLLTMLVSITGAKNVLEIGALGGYSGICLARGFEKGGNLTSLEIVEEYVKLAHRNLAKAGFGDQVTYMTGPAIKSLEQLVKLQNRFDFFFIDADKENYVNYLSYCIDLAVPGALIVTDNVLAKGSVVDANVPPKRYTESMKTFNETVAKHPQLQSILIPLGDGLTVSRVIK